MSTIALKNLDKDDVPLRKRKSPSHYQRKKICSLLAEACEQEIGSFPAEKSREMNARGTPGSTKFRVCSIEGDKWWWL